MYQELSTPTEARVLVHTDLGLHNLAIDSDSLEVRGVFHYEGAAWADRHHDFRYLVFDQGFEHLFEAAVSVYQPAVGHTISRERVLLYNAACAITFLAFRVGSAPNEKPCGRSLAEDLRWTRGAIARVLE